MKSEKSFPGQGLPRASSYPFIKGGALGTKEECGKESDSSSGNVAVLRGKKKEQTHGPKWTSCVHKVIKKGSDVSPYAVCTTTVGQKNSESKHSKVLEINTHFREAEKTASDASKFKVILIQEGLGNLKDCFFYTKDCLKQAAALFEGKKSFADHANKLEEQIHPERSTRDILGYFEKVAYVESNGRGQLEGILCLPAGEHFEWARSLLTNSLEYATKYPSAEFVGLSINAEGEADTVPIADFMRSYKMTDDVKAKLDQAVSEGIEEIRPVSILKEARSCDLVTEAGAGGKILTMMEKDKRPMGKKKIRESKVREGEEEGEDTATPAVGADGKDDHADADQDMALFQKMIKQYLGDGEGVDEEEAMHMAKHAYEAYQSEGMKQDEAYEAAGSHLKMAMKIGKAMSGKKDGDNEAPPAKEAEEEAEAKAKEAEEEEKSKEAQAVPTSPGKKPAPMAHGESNMRNELLKANGEIAKLRESIGKIEVEKYLEKKMIAESGKRSVECISKFREALGNPKSIAQIEDSWKIFTKAYDAGAEENQESDGLLTEKTTFHESTGRGNVLDLTGCA